LKYSAELNELQEATLEAISFARNQIEIQFSNHAEDRNLVDYTLKHLFAYLSERSQAVSYLVSSNMVWDAEIVLRSFYETAAKIWFICLSRPDQRDALVEEFWGPYASMHSHKRANRASPAAEVFKRNKRPDDEIILSMLGDPRLFDFGENNKKDRKSLEQKWSFTEIIKFLGSNSPEGFDLQDVPGLLHMYGQQSHLIHADESALDLMLDRKLRAPEEYEILASAHVCRIFSDQASLWSISALALSHRYDRKTEIGNGLQAKHAKLHDLAKPFLDRFQESQAEFYRNITASPTN
jgi:hypothetical protein